MSALALQAVLIVLLLITVAYAALILIELIRLGRGDVPYVPSTGSAIRAAIHANALPKDGLILDLGAGDARALRMLAKAGYTGPFIGYERAPLPFIFGSILSRLQRRPVTLHFKDFKQAPLEDAKGIYLFLLQEVLADLAPELKRRLPPGTVVVSAEFPIAGWTPTQTLQARGVTAKQASVFVYHT